MATIKQTIPPSEPTYLVELTQDELDIIGGLAEDLADPNRHVKMYYDEDDHNWVQPTERGRNALKSIRDGLTKAQADRYDYEDYWEYKHD